MRYLLAPLLLLSATDCLFSQVYEVIPRDFGGGYKIVDGGTLTVVDGEIAEWDVHVDGPTPFRFNNETASVSSYCCVTITPTEIKFDYSDFPDPDPHHLGFAFWALESPVGCNSCDARLGWNFTVGPEQGRRVGGRFSNPTGNFEYGAAGDILVIAQAVPEPTSAAVLISGLAVTGTVRRTRRRL